MEDRTVGERRMGGGARRRGGSLESGPDGMFRALSAAAVTYVTVLAGPEVVALGSWEVN